MSFTNWFLLRCTASVGYASGIASTSLKYKLEGQWCNSESQLLYICWTNAIEATELDEQHKALLTASRDVVCVVLDEDSHYRLRMFYFLEKLFEKKETINIIPLTTPLERKNAGAQLIPYNSSEWNMIHRSLKSCILPMLGIAAMAPAIKLKAKFSQKKPEAVLLAHCFDWVISMDEPLRRKHLDPIRAAYRTIRDVSVILTNDDKQIREFSRRFISEIVAREIAFRNEMNRARAAWNWEQEYRKLQENERLILEGRIVEPDDICIQQDPLRYRMEAEIEMNRLKTLRERKEI